MEAPPPVSHGTHAGYVHGCRERCCKEAAARYARIRRERRAEENGQVMATIDKSWATGAACADVDTELFYPPEQDRVPAEVRFICAGCPVRIECLSYALHHEELGVWAATSPAQRRQMRKRDRIRLRRPYGIVDEREVASW